jgi:tetratricopeptide (TPR) repeat protein
MVGADPRLPATATKPHNADDNTIPAMPTTNACQKEIPKSSTNDPYDKPSTVTFAANQGQNRSRGPPFRSVPEMTFIPLTSGDGILIAETWVIAGKVRADGGGGVSRAVTAGAAFGQLLRSCRRASGLSQEELAARAGVGVRTICDLERGRRARPYRQTVDALAEALALQGPQLAEFVRLSRPGQAPDGGQARSAQPSSQTVPDLAGGQLGTPAQPCQLPAAPCQLPAAVSHFTGREAELEMLTSLLTEPSGLGTVVISALTGTAGVGKTALAMRWAHQVADRFPDGQLYVNLRGYDPAEQVAAADALAGFLRALGLPGPDIPADEEERAARYRSVLAGRQILVVLDNARDADQVRPLLPGSPGSIALVTSRDALTGLISREGARRLDVDLLPLADTVRLLKKLIGDRVDSEPESAAALAALCGRLPLAVRVAAELAAARPGDSLASLAAELADQRHRLDLLAADSDPRTSVRAVFSWSLRHLDPDAASAFRLLSAHPGPDLDAYAAAALTGTGLWHARCLLDRLARAHLIQATGPSRYAMHDLLRDYARELAAADNAGQGVREALTRLLDYYLHAAAAANELLYAPGPPRPAGPWPLTVIAPPLAESAAARAWLTAELPCLAAAVGIAATHGWARQAIELSASLFLYLDGGGYHSEAVTIYRQALSAARQLADAATEARVLANLGVAELRQGSDQRAADHLRQALAGSRREGDRLGEARALNNLGILAFWHGRYEQAASCYRLSLNLNHETGNRASEVPPLVNLAGVQIRLGRLEQATSNLQRALALARDTGQQDREVSVLLNLADVSSQQREYEQAAAYLQEGLARCQDTGYQVGEAAALTGLGEVDLRQGHYQAAARQLFKALALSREARARTAELAALNLLGEVSLATGDSGQAREHHASALALACHVGDTHVQARAHDGLARAHQADRDFGQARHHWQQALTIYTKRGAPEADQVRARLTAAGGNLQRQR